MGEMFKCAKVDLKRAEFYSLLHRNDTCYLLVVTDTDNYDLELNQPVS